MYMACETPTSAAGRWRRRCCASCSRWLDGSLLVGHNVAFDLRMLFAQAARLGLAAPAVDFADTLQLARRFIQAPDYSLAGLAKHLGLEHQPDHRAMLDVEATCELLALLLPKVAEREVERRALLDREAEPFADLAGLLDDWRALAESCRPAELLDQVLDESGLVRLLRRRPAPRRLTAGAAPRLRAARPAEPRAGRSALPGREPDGPGPRPGAVGRAPRPRLDQYDSPGQGA